MSKKERTQRLLDRLRVWCDRGQDRLQWVSEFLVVSPQRLERWFSRTEEPIGRQVSRLRGLVGKLIDEVETADLINSAIFGGRGKLILGDPVRGEPDVLVNLPEGKFWIEITRAIYSQEHMKELSAIKEKSDTESMVTNLSKEEFPKYSIPLGFQFAINEKAKKTYSVTDPVNLAIVHFGPVDDSESTIETLRKLSRPNEFKFERVFLVFWTRRCREDEWYVMQQYPPLPEQPFLGTSSYLLSETAKS